MKKRTKIIICSIFVSTCALGMLIVHSRNWYVKHITTTIEQLDSVLGQKENSINAMQSSLKAQNEELDHLENELNELLKTNPKLYNEKIQVYNTLAQTINENAKQLDKTLSEFLAEVENRNIAVDNINKKIFIVEYFKSFSSSNIKK